jgi:hypothetical protein
MTPQPQRLWLELRCGNTILRPCGQIGGRHISDLNGPLGPGEIVGPPRRYRGAMRAGRDHAAKRNVERGRRISVANLCAVRGGGVEEPSLQGGKGMYALLWGIRAAPTGKHCGNDAPAFGQDLAQRGGECAEDASK